MSKTKKLKKLVSSYPNIMADIGCSLEDEKLQCKKSRSEIVVINSDKKSVKSIISSLIDKDDCKLLLDIVGAKGNVYIRQKCS